MRQTLLDSRKIRSSNTSGCASCEAHNLTEGKAMIISLLCTVLALWATGRVVRRHTWAPSAVLGMIVGVLIMYAATAATGRKDPPCFYEAAGWEYLFAVPCIR